MLRTLRDLQELRAPVVLRKDQHPNLEAQVRFDIHGPVSDHYLYVIGIEMPELSKRHDGNGPAGELRFKVGETFRSTNFVNEDPIVVYVPPRQNCGVVVIPWEPIPAGEVLYYGWALTKEEYCNVGEV